MECFDSLMNKQHQPPSLYSIILLAVRTEIHSLNMGLLVRSEEAAHEDDMLYQKIRLLSKQSINNLNRESLQSNYSYERFCSELNPNDRFVQRLFELLIKESASRQKRSKQPSDNRSSRSIQENNSPGAAAQSPNEHQSALPNPDFSNVGDTEITTHSHAQNTVHIVDERAGW
ncbi:hypothetical protein NEOLI_002404 [Neolecta irregularis DAH-3]|uniref:Uncharacterized protein n=1 Tax=Neolecta irregularis (strain DAH-3) TaxID=1198029 RepID=A0A1U7LJR8_NEOID|nr:hypothetical protein NEOLI_002404 [Neolecta irregularis DAH-3]|eukprot:OLL22878.1 hypothetical protein NEOLI_002404 [Neolecta irregularis DAH-3]